MLKAGFSRVDITPPLGIDLAGYFGRRIARGVLDPLYAVAVAISSEEETVLLLTLDCLGVTEPFIEKFKAGIVARTGVPADHVMIAALHQHTSFVLHGGRENSVSDAAYLDVLYRRVADAAVMAMDDRREATLATAEEELTTPLAFVRRYFGEDGKVYTNPPATQKVVAHCDTADNTVRVVRLARQGAPDVAILNFSTHPDVIGGELYSADWPGLTRTYFEEKLGDVRALMLTGTQGDSNHVNYLADPADRFPHGIRYEHAKYMARTIGDTAARLFTAATPSGSDAVSAAVTVIRPPANLDGIGEYEACRAFMDDYHAGKLGARHITELGRASRILGLATSPAIRTVALTAIRVGDVLFAGFGGEAFTAYGRAVRKMAPDLFVVTAVCANGYAGYFPTAKAFSEGGYEASSSPFTPALEEEILSGFRDMLK